MSGNIDNVLVQCLTELEDIFDDHENPRIVNTKETKCGCKTELPKTDICEPTHCHIIHEDYFHTFEALYRNKDKIKQSLKLLELVEKRVENGGRADLLTPIYLQSLLEESKV